MKRAVEVYSWPMTFKNPVIAADVRLADVSANVLFSPPARFRTGNELAPQPARHAAHHDHQEDNQDNDVERVLSVPGCAHRLDQQETDTAGAERADHRGRAGIGPEVVEPLGDEDRQDLEDDD